MSINTLFYIIIAVLVLFIFVTCFFAFVDWRAIIVRKFGPNYKKGLAHILINGVWIYRDSRLVFEGDDAMTYSREIDNKKGTFVEDIVPNKIGFDYDEYTGQRVYRVMPGGTIGYSDAGSRPSVDYPQNLISIHVLDRTVSNYAASVNAETSFNWKPVLIIVGIIAILAVILFSTGVLKLPGSAQTPISDNQTSTTQKVIPDNGQITYIEDR